MATPEMEREAASAVKDAANESAAGDEASPARTATPLATEEAERQAAEEDEEEEEYEYVYEEVEYEESVASDEAEQVLEDVAKKTMQGMSRAPPSPNKNSAAKDRMRDLLADEDEGEIAVATQGKRDQMKQLFRSVTKGTLSASTTPTRPASAQTLRRWETDVSVLQTSISLMLSNETRKAEQMLQEQSTEIASRKIDFDGREHDLRGLLSLISALFGGLNGLATMEMEQFETVLARTKLAESLLTNDADWTGKKVVRGLCMLVGGLVRWMTGHYTRGIVKILRAWPLLKNLETEGLDFCGHERGVVRSLALLGLGTFNLISSTLSQTQMRMADWVTGFKGGRDVALHQLYRCWKEEGLMAPFAAIIYTGFAVDSSTFLGESRALRAEALQNSGEILTWAGKTHPGAFLFGGLRAQFLAANRDLPGALADLQDLAKGLEQSLAFRYAVCRRQATFHASLMDWPKAADAFLAAVELQRRMEKRGGCPTLAMNAFLCYVAAGEQDKGRAVQALDLARSYTKVDKEWSNIDKLSMEQAEVAHMCLGRKTADGPSLPWSQRKPLLLLYSKLVLVNRAVTLMDDAQVEALLAAVRKETEQGAGDADCLCAGLLIQAEACRQNESWDDALRLATECLQLEGQLSLDGRRVGFTLFARLVAAQANYVKENFSEALDRLNQMEALGKEHFFQQQVDFKATHVRKLVTQAMQARYLDVAVPARGVARLLVTVPAGCKLVEWDWRLEEKTVHFSSVFDSPKKTTIIQEQKEHSAAQGAFTGKLEPAEAGSLALKFDNSFSLFRGKKVQLRITPADLKIERFES